MLEPSLKNARSNADFKKQVFSKVRPKGSSFYGINEFSRVKYLTTLRLEHSHLKAHKFRLGFVDTEDNLCSTCGVVEDTKHFFLLCRRFLRQREALRSEFLNLTNIDLNDSSKSNAIIKLLLFGESKFSFSLNTQILILSTNYISSTGRLDWAPPP